jgi:hypothetical protein
LLLLTLATVAARNGFLGLADGSVGRYEAAEEKRPKDAAARFTAGRFSIEKMKAPDGTGGLSAPGPSPISVPVGRRDDVLNPARIYTPFLGIQESS